MSKIRKKGMRSISKLFIYVWNILGRNRASQQWFVVFNQKSSYEAQIAYYRDKIQENLNWKNAGIYEDDGKSATNTKKGDDFNAMIEDCMARKIDMVLTKSVSRFARNTVDSIQNIRKLKEKNIVILFEKEN